MAESSVRIERKKGYTTLQNDMIRDPRLSLKAKGMMAVLMGLPENWQYSISGLCRICGVGKDAIRGALKELETAGYLEREQSHDETGRFSGSVYVVHDLSNLPLAENPPTVAEIGEPLAGFPMTEKPSSENPTQYNKQESSKDLDNPPPPPKGGQGKRQKRKSKYDLADDAKPILRAYVGEDRELARALGGLIEVRVEKKAINSARAIRMLLDELDRLSGGRREDKLRILRQSVTNSWKSVFPLRGGSGPGGYDPGPARLVEEEGTYLL